MKKLNVKIGFEMTAPGNVALSGESNYEYDRHGYYLDELDILANQHNYSASFIVSKLKEIFKNAQTSKQPINLTIFVGVNEDSSVYKVTTTEDIPIVLQQLAGQIPENVKTKPHDKPGLLTNSFSMFKKNSNLLLAAAVVSTAAVCYISYATSRPKPKNNY